MKLIFFNFVGNESLQVEHHLTTFGLFKVTDLKRALQALALIVEQGEGSNICKPQWVAANIYEGLSHYYSFMSIVKEHSVTVYHDSNNAAQSNATQEVWFFYLLTIEN